MNVPAELSTTRRALHAVAELLIAGPQYEAVGDIRLAARPGGFGGWVGPTPSAVSPSVNARSNTRAADAVTSVGSSTEKSGPPV